MGRNLTNLFKSFKIYLFDSSFALVAYGEKSIKSFQIKQIM